MVKQKPETVKGSVFNPEKPNPVQLDKKSFNSLYIPMITPTRDNLVDDQLTLNLISIAQMLKKEYVRVTATASTIHIARTEGFKLLKRAIAGMGYPDTNTLRGFMVDSDIRWDASENEKIAQEVRKADQEGYSFVVPYRIRDNTSLLSPTVDTDPVVYHAIPIAVYFAEWKNYQPADVAGLGFYYGDLPLDYQFRFTEYGEDMNFFLDNRIKPKVVKTINLFHVKKMLLGLKEVRYL